MAGGANAKQKGKSAASSISRGTKQGLKGDGSSSDEGEEDNLESKYIEKVQIEGLTLYEINREPRKLFLSPATVTSPLRPLSLEFTCPVCLRLMRRTLIVKECLHRFCSECIQKCLRVGNKECPSCRIHIPSRRSLRSDNAFDRLIGLVYPDLDRFEAREEKRIEEFNRIHNIHNAFTESFQRGTAEQLEQRRRKRYAPTAPINSASADKSSSRPGQEAPSEENHNLAATTTSDSESEENSSEKRRRKHSVTDDANPNEAQFAAPKPQNEEICFVLRRHPAEHLVQRLDKEYLCTSVRFTIHHIKRFLALRLEYPHFEDFEVIIPHQDGAVILDNKLCLQDIQAHFSGPFTAATPLELILYFRISPRRQAQIQRF